MRGSRLSAVFLTGCIFAAVFLPSPASDADSGALRNAESVQYPSDPFGDNPLDLPSSRLPQAPPQSAFLGVTFHLNAAGGDAVNLNHVGQLEDGRQFNLARNVGDALGLSRDSYSADVALPSFSEEFNKSIEEGSGSFEEDSFSSDVVEDEWQLSLDGRLTKRNGADWTLNINTAPLLRVAKNYGYQGIELEVCTPDVAVSDTSSRRPDIPEECSRWSQDATDDPLLIGLTEHPEAGKYGRFVLVLAMIAGIATVGLIGLTLLLRRWIRTLGGGALTLVGIATVFAMLSTATAALVLAFIDEPFHNYVLARDLDEWGYIASVVAPSFLFAVPFLAMAAGFAWLPPPAPRPAQAMSGGVGSQPGVRPSPAGPGVPSWLYSQTDGAPARSGPPPSPGWAPPPPAQTPPTGWQNHPPTEQPPPRPQVPPIQQGPRQAPAPPPKPKTDRGEPPDEPNWQAPG